jgi:hypothetical protein
MKRVRPMSGCFQAWTAILLARVRLGSPGPRSFKILSGDEKSVMVIAVVLGSSRRCRKAGFAADRI